MKTVTSIKLDRDVKKEASKIASEMGLNLSSVVNATLKNFVAERRLVFSLAPEFNTKKEKVLLKAKSDAIKGKNVIGPFSNIEEIKGSLMG
ncbi:MAG: type II toxin-antitoxin system RelB/DinJ family antitoxin [bacterium]|nr:type II toxin-antitoxin system RelB/DinJ family antitoxin [bacterium]